MNSFRFFLVAVLTLALPLWVFGQSLEHADSLNKVGKNYYEAGQYREAETHYKQAYDLYKKLAGAETWLSPGIDYAEILVDRSKYQPAIELFKKLNEVARRLDDTAARARIENDLGWVYGKIDANDEALKHLKNALPLAGQIGDTLRLGFISNNIGSIYNARGDYREGLKYREKSLAYLQQIDAKSYVSIALNNIARTYEELALYDKAIDYYEQSLEIRKELGNVFLLSSTYNNIGSLQQELGQYDEAIVSFEKSLELRRKAGRPQDLAFTLNNIGTYYHELGQYERALEYYQRALEIEKSFAGPASLATSYKNIADMLWEFDQEEKSIEYYELALDLQKKGGNILQVANDMIDLASIRMRVDKFDEADRFLARAQTIADSTEDKSLQREHAQVYARLVNYQSGAAAAIPHHKKALEYSKDLSFRASIDPLKALAYRYNELESDSSLFYGKQAINHIERMLSDTGSLSEFKASYFESHSPFYTRMATWHLEYNGDKAAAYELVEKAKARALTSDLAQAASQIDQLLPQQERITRAQMRAEITELYSQLQDAKKSERIEALKQQIRDKELSYAAFENRLQQEYDQFKHIESPAPPSLADVQKMNDTESAVLEYAVLNDELLVFLIGQEEVHTLQVALQSDSAGKLILSQQVKAFREAIINREPEPVIKEMGRNLYKTLIGPLDDEISKYKNILLVPDNYLAYLPFEALSNGDYLVSQYNIKYAPSMTGFNLIRETGRSFEQQMLAIGNASNYQAADQAAMLPTAGLEVQQIKGLLEQVTVLENEDVTEQNVRKMMENDFKYIHVAAHSIIDEENSFMSGILLGSSSADAGLGLDGYLRSSEIHLLNLKSEMVVLSACKSGLGELISGEGMLGLQRSFFNAGASTVVVSLWDVYDRSTSHFMKTFYGAIASVQENQSWGDTWHSVLRWSGWDESIDFGYAAPSMRQAKLAMLEHPQYNHPVYWAPFVVVGR